MTLSRHRAAFHQARSAASAEALGDVPRWTLVDLYAGMDAPAFGHDLDAAGLEAERFAADYRGNLAALADGRRRWRPPRRGGRALREAR